MRMKTTQPNKVKAIDEKGHFEGYGAVFNNIDSQDDVILPGAFKDFKYNANGKISIPTDHNLSQIVGEAEVIQDDHGLYVKGRLELDLDEAKQAYIRMKSGLVNAMSVGFNILSGGVKQVKKDEKNVWEISKAELWEVSIVPFGANNQALISSVKAQKSNTIREFEKFLIDNGYSRKEAAGIAVSGFNFEREAQKSNELESVKNAFESFKLN